MTHTANRPRFTVTVATPIDVISAKLQILKAFRIYPSREDVEILVSKLVPEDTAYVVDNAQFDPEQRIVLR